MAALLLLLLGILLILSICPPAELFAVFLALSLLSGALCVATFGGASAVTLVDVVHLLLHYSPVLHNHIPL
ncbi:hypothetical protein C1932_09905 [Stenotrophomonas sp. YAU14D1_LEIMI4_1]|nr:hypothetical protein C1932_09905 [Stenotrophomonas sp. YAU14D1_LEIMI4_1]